MIAEPTGTDGRRPIGRPWHASPWKNSSLAEAICWSTRNMLPLPHPENIRSSQHLTIRGFCLCLATLKPHLILTGRSRPRNGELCSSGSSKGNRSVTSPVITVCRRYVGRVSTDHPRNQYSQGRTRMVRCALLVYPTQHKCSSGRRYDNG